MAEGSKALAWKVSIRQIRIEGSNPSRSATKAVPLGRPLWRCGQVLKDPPGSSRSRARRGGDDRAQRGQSLSIPSNTRDLPSEIPNALKALLQGHFDKTQNVLDSDWQFDISMILERT